MVLTIVTLGPLLSLATPSWFSATGTEQESFLDTCKHDNSNMTRVA